MYLLPVAQYPSITPVQVTVTATYPGADSKTLADSVASPIEQQINGVDNMLYMSSISSLDRPAHDDGVLLARHRPRHRAGAGAEPRQPRDAAAAVRRRAAGRERAEEVVVDHDAGRGVREGRPLQRELHRELRERLRAERAEARQRRGPGADHGRAQPGDADLDESRPHGLARHHDVGHRQRDQPAEPALRRRADRPAAERGAGRAHVSRSSRSRSSPSPIST